LFGFDTALIHRKGTKHTKVNKINILRMPHDLCVLCAFLVEKAVRQHWNGVTRRAPTGQSAGAAAHPDFTPVNHSSRQ
jgi:hypothetical protein